MTDTNNTDGAALLPVTQADRDFVDRFVECCIDGHDWSFDESSAHQLVAAFRQTHSPATQEDAERSGVGMQIECGTCHGTGIDESPGYYDGRAECPQCEGEGSTPAMSDRQEYDGEAVREALIGLEWTDDGYSLRTPYDGDVDGDGRHVVVGGEVVVTFADSEVGDEYRERILAALAHPAQAPAQTVDETERLPRLDDGLIEAAMFAHYGRWAAKLGINGLDLTADDRNWTFREGFKRMWAGVRKELKRREALRPQEDKDHD